MKSSRTLRSALLVGLIVVAAAGCRKPANIVLDSPGAGVHYDTAHEALLKSGKSLPLLEAWRPYVDTLAEPVAVVRWREGVSTWEVFFATNRQPEAAGAEGQLCKFGNVPLQTPEFGRAEVTLPERRRGVDPKREETPSKWSAVGLWLRKDPSQDEVAEAVRFEQVRRISRDEFAEGVRGQLAKSRQQDLFLFVHGFNVDCESAIVRAAQIALDMPFNGAVVAYSWPTQGGVQNYSADEPVNAASVQPFAEFLQGLLEAVPPGTRVHLLAHSMGNRIVMQALGRLPVGPEKRIANVVLCAPDVGLSDFHNWAPGVIAQSERVTLYASVSDSALILSKGVHAEQRAGDADPPVTLAGIETIDCSGVDFDCMGHSYYGANVDVLADLFALIKQNRPAEQRPYLARQANGPESPPYWEFEGRAPKLLWTWHFDEDPAEQAEVQRPGRPSAMRR